MNKTVEEASVFAEALLAGLPGMDGIEVIICPPFTALYPLSQKCAGSPVQIAPQNMHWEAKGAFTGEISAGMIQECHCHYVVLGHSERRHIFRETSEEIGKKVKAALDAHLCPILCVGETIEEREVGKTEQIIKEQLLLGLTSVSPEKASQVVVAYEPVWAIGTGKAATPDDAHFVISYIRQFIGEEYGPVVAEAVRILYGGSVTPDNVYDFMKDPDIDGTLVGGASLDPAKFLKIIQESRRAK